MIRILRYAFLIAISIVTLHVNLHAQSATATLSGAVTDQAGANIAQATVTLQNTATGLKRTTTTNSEGAFTMPLLPPGNYTVTVEQSGFATITHRDVTLNVGDQRSLLIQLRVSNVSATVNVTDRAPLLNEAPTVSTVINRQFVENLPLNGRSFQSLINLTPGVVPVFSNSQRQGQFSVNGQRESSNYFTVDGVSANLGVQVNGTQFYGIGGEYPGFNAQGGTNSLVSVDALEEFRIQTSTYAPEFGRTPGAQVSIVTRSGTNSFHGSLFEYLRNEALDANDWFANRNLLAKPPLRQNQFGGTFSGPVYLPRKFFGPAALDGRDRTFFFFSQESLRLRLPKVATNIRVPSLSVRQRATGPLAIVVNAFPLPNGAESTNGFAFFNASYSDPSNSTATAIRLDHQLSDKLRVFGRYNYAPSENVIRGQSGNSLGVLRALRYEMQTVTLGLTYVPSARVINDLRINYSRNDGERAAATDSFGGSRPPDAAALLPSFADISNTELAFNLEGFTGPTLVLGQSTNNAQRQLNIVDTLSRVRGAHEFKFGVDYRQLRPVFAYPPYSLFVRFDNLNQALTGIARSVSVSSTDTPLYPQYMNLSLFAQDTWRASKQLTVTYGIRYELNPPPGEGKDRGILAVRGVDNFATMNIAPRGTPLYETSWNNFAPRLGVAHQLTQSARFATMVRGGVGIYYDTTPTQIGQAYDPFNAPFGGSSGVSLTPYPTNPDLLRRPATSTNPPYFGVIGFEPDLKLPYSIQGNLAVEQSLGTNQSLTATYLTAHGKRLYRSEFYNNPNPTFTTFRLTRDDATSSYHALQLQFTRRLARGLQALASYTLSSSIDNASNDAAGTASRLIDPRQNRGPSDFDRRQSFSTAVTYDFPTPNFGRVGRAVFGGFSVDTIVKYLSAAPFNVTVTRALTGDPFGNNSVPLRPDVAANAAFYLSDATVPGGQRLNAAAFTVPAELRQGNLSRNGLRGFSLRQVDFALRRQFKLAERIVLQMRGEAFNLFNTPNFADPSGTLGSVNTAGVLTPSATFGLTSSMLNRSIGGLNSLYQIGGPRSIQLGLRLQF